MSHIQHLATGRRVRGKGEVIEQAEEILLALVGQVGIRLVHQKDFGCCPFFEVSKELDQIAQEILETPTALSKRILAPCAVSDGEDYVEVANCDGQAELVILRPPLRQVERLLELSIHRSDDAIG